MAVAIGCAMYTRLIKCLMSYFQAKDCSQGDPADHCVSDCQTAQAHDWFTVQPAAGLSLEGMMTPVKCIISWSSSAQLK